ncbi:MAG: MFS transporter, partial [Planctomycetaceae bacterium]
SGVMALDIGGKQASGTVSGISDAAGYFGAILSGYTIGVLAQRFGWSTAFLALAAVAILALVAAFAYWLLNERQLNLAATAAPDNPPDPTP